MTPSVLVVGGVSWDTIVRVDRFPEPRPQTVFARGARETVGSTGAGKAMNLARLGVPTTLHAMLGDDGPGRRAAGALRDAGVRLVAERDPAGTERHVNLMADGGGRLSIYAQPATFEPEVDLPALESLAASQDHVVVNIVNYARRLLPALRAAGREIWCDVHDWDGRSPYHADFVEAADRIFLSADALEDPKATMERLVRKGKKLVVCTFGREGALALTGEGAWIRVPAVPGVEAVDTNGAGDAFFAGTLFGHLRGDSTVRALRAGAVVAAWCVRSTELAHPDLSAERVAADLEAWGD
jgi:sugar/nucleoside kinase (ribokinase family)